jgi:threonine/homoserine/homoserine lactone efflux protein
MIELSIALVIFLFPLAYSPGPGNLFFAANGAKFGMSATLPSNIGYHIATWLVTVIIGLGFGEITQQYPLVFQYVGIAGSCYVLYLSWIFFNAGTIENTSNSKKISFWDGVILLLLNPKAYVIIVAMFTQFLKVDNGLYTVLLISTIFTINNLLAFLAWTYFGDKLIYKFKNEKNARFINISFGIILGLIAVWMLIRTFL